MVKEQFREYNGIKVGDTIKINKSTGECYTGYTDWLSAFHFDTSRWGHGYTPTCNSICTVLGIAKHLEYGRSPETTDILFYVDDGKRTYIMGIQGIELYCEPKRENRNSYITQGKIKIFTIID